MDDEWLVALRARLSGYVVDSVIGQGGAGRVLSAEHLATARLVAIKQLAGEALNEHEARDRLHREAQVLSGCAHPNLVEFIAFHEFDDMVVLILERIPGGSLASLLDDRPLDVRSSCELMLGIGGALAHLHQRGFLHCDVKPENVLFTAHGTPVLIDLGLARALPATPDSGVSGTPRYMAPEQVVCAELHPATDVYSCGMMLYELLAGHFPFPPADTTAAIMRQQLELLPAPLDEVAPQVPPPIVDVVMAAIDKRLSHRIPTAAALVERLAEALGPGRGPRAELGDQREGVAANDVGPGHGVDS